MRSTLLGIPLCLAILTGSGCVHRQPVETMPPPEPALALIPVPTGFPMSTQATMQAVHHWEVLAEDVARRVHEALERRILERQFPVYVAPSGTTPFAKSFHALLVSRLVERGIPVSSSLAEAMILSFDIEVIRHGSRAARAARGASGDLAAGEETPAPSAKIPAHSRMEVLITSSLVFGERFVMRNSSIYSINDVDWWHYRQHALPSQPETVTIRLVDR